MSSPSRCVRNSSEALPQSAAGIVWVSAPPGFYIRGLRSSAPDPSMAWNSRSGRGGYRRTCATSPAGVLRAASIRTPSLGPANEWSPARLCWATGRPRGVFLRKWAAGRNRHRTAIAGPGGAGGPTQRKRSPAAKRGASAAGVRVSTRGGSAPSEASAMPVSCQRMWARGLEPPRVTPLEPKSSASANSATPTSQRGMLRAAATGASARWPAPAHPARPRLSG